MESEGASEITQIVKDHQGNMGCRLTGQLEVYKAPGHIRVYLESSMYSQLADAGYLVDMSHRIDSLQFGEDSDELRDMK